MARLEFEKDWKEPSENINGGVRWTPITDELSIEDMNNIVSNLNYLKAEIDAIKEKLNS
jgi:hypothetical protein